MMIALPGFLGLPSDFSCLSLTGTKISPAPLEQWAKSFNETLTTKNNILIGYSMGARLAMHALIQNPALYKKAIFISGHPGLKEGHAARLIHDSRWADRFLTEEWRSLLFAWNNQTTFGSHFLHRKEEDFKREELADQLRLFSLGHQKDLSKILNDLPTYWIVGALDTKFIEATQHQKNRHVIPDASHRLLWEAQEQLKKTIELIV
jgi:2-succinyl-6-hydroxy-2,4-cyclohexadiene-1-carboxylate synthase